MFKFILASFFLRRSGEVPRDVGYKYTVMRFMEVETKKYSAGETQQQFARLDQAKIQ
jgi:hypothetical protein